MRRQNVARLCLVGLLSSAMATGQEPSLKKPLQGREAPQQEQQQNRNPNAGPGQNQSRSQGRRRGRRGFDSRFTRNNEAMKTAFSGAVSRAASSTVRVLRDDKPVCLGCIVSTDGEILTKATLVPDGKLTCRLADGRVLPADLVAADRRYDVAMLKIPATELTPLELDGSVPGVGNLVAATAEDGKVLAIGLVSIELLQSGARSRSGSGQANRGYLGIRVEAGSDGGLKIVEVVSNSPASRAGLKPGDFFATLSGNKVNSTQELLAVLARFKPGDEVELAIKRDETEKPSTVKLGKVPGGIPEDRWGGGPFSERRFNFPQVIAHDTVLRPSDCGGPLVTARGEVVGLNIARALRVTSYAIPAATLKTLAAKLRVQNASSSDESKKEGEDAPAKSAASEPAEDPKPADKGADEKKPAAKKPAKDGQSGAGKTAEDQSKKKGPDSPATPDKSSDGGSHSANASRHLVL